MSCSSKKKRRAENEFSFVDSLLFELFFICGFIEWRFVRVLIRSGLGEALFKNVGWLVCYSENFRVFLCLF